MKTPFLLPGFMAAVLLAAGCAVGPDYKPPAMSAPEHFAGGAPGGFTTNEPVADWWRGFGDAELARLVERAVASNLDLRIATANLLQARALRLGAKADFLPVAEGQASYNNVKYSEAEVFDAPGAQLHQELYTAGFDATWELDIFGRVRRAYQGSTLRLKPPPPCAATCRSAW